MTLIAVELFGRIETQTQSSSGIGHYVRVSLPAPREYGNLKIENKLDNSTIENVQYCYSDYPWVFREERYSDNNVTHKESVNNVTQLLRCTVLS